MHTYLEFESQVAELEGKIAELRALAVDDPGMSIDEEVGQLERKAAKSLADLYAALTPWRKTRVARHALRPHFLDYQRQLFRDFITARRRSQLRRRPGDRRWPGLVRRDGGGAHRSGEGP